MNPRECRGICAAALFVVVLPIMSGCWPKNFLDPQYDFEQSTNGYSFETPHEPTVMYQALLAVVEDDGRKIEERFDDELRMYVILLI